MNFSLLPDVFGLVTFIGAFRPLVRRAGAHVDLWFLGWGFLLLQTIVLFFGGFGGWRTQLAHMLSTALLELCGLSFALAAGTSATRRMPVTPFVEIAVPVLLQVWLSGMHGTEGHGTPLRSHWVYVAVNLLFLLPLTRTLLHRNPRRRLLLTVTGSFALLAVLTLPIAASRPETLTACVLALIYCSAAYIYLRNARRFTQGEVLAVVGLAAWGLKYPFVVAMAHYFAAVRIDRALLNAPQYLVIAGTILTLLQDHLVLTERMAMHDPLTDLPNLRMFEEHFAEAMEDARKQRTTVACLVIDVDNFKAINDTLGHIVGDALLRALAVRLSWHMSDRDLLARTGGDEFTAMLAGVTDEHHLRFVASAMMSAVSVPVEVDGLGVDVRISMGIALSPDDADTMEDLRRAADDAMYRAKRRGGNLLAFAGEAAGERADQGGDVRDAPHVPAPVLQMTPQLRAQGAQPKSKERRPARALRP